MSPTNLGKKAKKLLSDRRGQSSIEYILILAVVVIIVTQFKSTIVAEIQKITTQVTGKIQSAIQ